MNHIDINQCHKLLLKIAIEFDQICTKYDIPYYMLGGTMLGAIRHRGFIPWDDDMDFGVPRCYYNMLIQKLESELPSSLKLRTASKGEVLYDGCKIEDISTEIVEEGKEDKTGCLFIDIFPLDIGNGSWGVLSRNWWIKHIMGINIYKYQWPNTYVEKIVAFFVRLFPQNFFLKISRKMLFNSGDYILNYGGYWGAKEIVSKVAFGVPKRYEFEVTTFNGVSNSDMYLKKLYGNYMELPPIDKRHHHILSFKIIK